MNLKLTPSLNKFTSKHNAILILENGKIYKGLGLGKKGKTIGELCFNTSMTGYQEILTDPSYHKQILTFTFPHFKIFISKGPNFFDSFKFTLIFDDFAVILSSPIRIA